MLTTAVAYAGAFVTGALIGVAALFVAELETFQRLAYANGMWPLVEQLVALPSAILSVIYTPRMAIHLIARSQQPAASTGTPQPPPTRSSQPHAATPRTNKKPIIWTVLISITLGSVLATSAIFAILTISRNADAHGATPALAPILELSTPPPSTLDPTHKDLDAQIAEAAPAVTAVAAQAHTRVKRAGTHHQWTLTSATPPAEILAQSGVLGSQAITDNNGQRYTCVSYQDGTQIPRINLGFSRDLTYTKITNQFGEHQGDVHAITTIGQSVIQVQWLTWTISVDHIRLRAADAVRFVQEIQRQGATEFRLDLPYDADLSATYDVSNLLPALEANGMTCFNNP